MLTERLLVVRKIENTDHVEHHRLFCSLCPIEKSKKRSWYDNTAESLNNFIGRCAQSTVCKDLNRRLIESLLNETHRVAAGCESLSKHFIIVCNQYVGIKTRDGNDVHLEELGYAVLATTLNSCDRNMRDKKKAK